MINLNEEEKLLQNKLINIFIQHVKQGLIVITMIIINKEDSFFIEMTQYLTVIMLIFNLIASAFLLCFKREFPRLEYFLIYTLNLFVFLTLLVYSLKYFIEINEQNLQLSLYVKIYILVLLQKEIEILIIKIFPFDIANRQVNSLTSFIFVFMILLENDKYQCKQNYSNLLLSHLIVHSIMLIFNTIFNLLILNQKKSQKELRIFSDQVITVFSLVHIVLLVTTFIQTASINLDECPCFAFIFNCFKFITPINFLIFIYVIYQEVQWFKQTLAYQELQDKNSQHLSSYSASIQKNNVVLNVQKDRQSIRSQSSVINNPMEASECNSQVPNFGKDKETKLQKLGTSQFGANQGMEHSWANVYDQNPFVQQVSKENSNNQQRGSKSVDESFIRQEESQLPENLSQLNNPMDSDSQILK